MAILGPCLRACLRIVLRCCGGIRRQMSHAVIASPTTPAFRVSIRTIRDTAGSYPPSLAQSVTRLNRRPGALSSAVRSGSGPKSDRPEEDNVCRYVYAFFTSHPGTSGVEGTELRPRRTASDRALH